MSQITPQEITLKAQGDPVGLTDPPISLVARLVPRGEEAGFDRRVAADEDRVMFVLPATEVDRERLVRLISAKTLARVSGTVPFEVAPDENGTFTLSKEESLRMAEWARATVANLTAERGETITHGSAWRIGSR